MSSGLLLLVAASTSLLAGLLARDRIGFGRALGLVMELAGLSTLFLGANLLLGLVIVLAVRSFASVFVSAYLLNDIAIVALSILQGALFFCWRRSR
jgi:hypothetical protein